VAVSETIVAAIGVAVQALGNGDRAATEDFGAELTAR
jgi:hypothetical protein